MWAKILAGAVAALAVVGIGVYVALPPSAGVADGGSCGECCHSGDSVEGCPGDTSTVCPSGPGVCCGGPPAMTVNTDALAACGGGMTVAPASKGCKLACCDE